MCFHTLNNCLPFGKSTFGKSGAKRGFTGACPRGEQNFARFF